MRRHTVADKNSFPIWLVAHHDPVLLVARYLYPRHSTLLEMVCSALESLFSQFASVNPAFRILANGLSAQRTVTRRSPSHSNDNIWLSRPPSRWYRIRSIKMRSGSLLTLFFVELNRYGVLNYVGGSDYTRNSGGPQVP